MFHCQSDAESQPLTQEVALFALANGSLTAIGLMYTLTAGAHVAFGPSRRASAVLCAVEGVLLAITAREWSIVVQIVVILAYMTATLYKLVNRT
jgi:hypothetical protein